MPNTTSTYEPLVLVDTADLPEEEWLEYRRRGIGGSDAAAILGVSPFATARDLYYDKLKVVSYEDGESNWVQKKVGHLLEDLVAEIFHVKTGFEIYQVKKMFYHPVYTYMLADIDYFIRLPNGKTAILEIKTTNYNAKDHWWCDGQEIVPVNYEIQGRHYMCVMNMDEVYFCCLYGNMRLEVDIMQRTISAMVGKGSVNHNSRKFKAENVDGSRTHLNIDYCNEPIKKIYHELFDEALKRYNEKQTRADRRIENYYEKIRNSKQEKPFHELILQIGDKENMSAESENGQLARQVLDEYYRGFQERNPNLKVFSAHLHMDEATPHLHIDFVPFTTGSKRGLDTRVSLKQALATQGFKGGTRGDTEWNQWVSVEKSALAFVMERHGIEWEHKGSHEKHLSVLDYKKQERATELEQLGAKIEEKQTEFNVLSERVLNYDDGLENLRNVEEMLDNAPEYQLSEPQGFMSVKAYKTKIAEPLIQKLKALIKTALARCFEGWDSYHIKSKSERRNLNS